MSDALDYLVRVRGDALGHYFKFLKDTGKHLDPKTRDLISVITKVHSQTEAGFKQYLMRALREGCTPMEVVDALLMAFPALGLAKIVWATEIILEMGIPEFSPELIASQPQWRDVMAVEDHTARMTEHGVDLLGLKTFQQNLRTRESHGPLPSAGHEDRSCRLLSEPPARPSNR